MEVKITLKHKFVRRNSPRQVAKALTACALVLAMGVSVSASTLFAGAITAETGNDGKNRFYSDYMTKAELQAAAEEKNEQIASEGMTLLKNAVVEDGNEITGQALPLEMGSKVSVFGARSDSIVLGGGGSGSVSSVGATMLYDSLEMAGFKLNPSLVSLYEGLPTKQQDVAYPNGTLNAYLEEDPAELGLDTPLYSNTYKNYSDAAIYVISRNAGEGADLPTDHAPGHEDITEHYLQLDDNERATLDVIKKYFKKIIVVINSANVMQLAELHYDPAISAILWMGQTGKNGAVAVGKILNGEVNPSGKTSDIYPADLTNDPTFYNFAYNSPFTMGENDKNYSITDLCYAPNADGKFIYFNDKNKNEKQDEGEETIWESSTAVTSVNYAENIYVGYKWYETASAGGAYEGASMAGVKADSLTKNGSNYASGATTSASDEYFNLSTGVLYPFGYGLSYSNNVNSNGFQWELRSVKIGSDATSWVDFDGNISPADLNKQIRVTVNVRNDSNYAGKEVVQLYGHDEDWKTNDFTQASENLLGFAKTDILEPGEDQDVEITVILSDMATFDTFDANSNGHKGWELEQGKYILTLNNDSHKVRITDNKLNINFTEDINMKQEGGVYKIDESDGAANVLFSNEDVNDTSGFKAYINNWDGSTKTATSTEEFISDNYVQKGQLTAEGALSGAAGKSTADIVVHPTKEGQKFSQFAYAYLYDESYENAFEDQPTDPWYIESVPDDWKQATEEYRKANPKADIQLWEMSGVTDDAKWTEFMNQLTLNELITIASKGGFSTAAIPAIGKPSTSDNDGPGQLKNGGLAWCAHVVIASTWNTQLAYEQGVIIGNESMFYGQNGWYGPGINFHRSPFAGRNFEYYSQDVIHMAQFAQAVISGAESKGCHTYPKHFFLDDQETHRSTGAGVCQFVTEQSIRELYMRVLEKALTGVNADGTSGLKGSGTMFAFGGIGLVHGSHTVYIDVLEKEWGFEGFHVSDIYLSGWRAQQLLRMHVMPMWLFGSMAGGSYEGVYIETKAGEALPDGTIAKEDTVGVYVPRDKEEEAAKEATLLSPTQWYWIRTTAEMQCRAIANNNAMKNGMVTTEYSAKTFDAVKSMAFSGSVAADFENQKVEYTISDGALPEGITLDAKTGALSGTPVAAGEYEFSVTVTADNWATTTVKGFKITVKEAITTESTLEAVAGEDFSANFSSDFKVGGTLNGSTIKAVKYSLRTDVPGLTMSDDGVLSGKPEIAGTYEIVVRVAVTIPGERVDSVENFDTTFVLTVSGDEASDKTIVSVEQVTEGNGGYKINFSDGTSITINNGADGQDGAPGKDGADGKSGCAGSVAPTALTVGAAMLLAVGVYVAVKVRKHKNNK